MLYGKYKFNRGKYSTADLEEGASTVSVTSGIANAIGVRVQNASGISSVTSGVATVASLKTVGQSAFSSNVTTTCNAQTTLAGVGTISSASTITCASQKILLGNSTDSYGIYGVSIISSDSELVMLASASQTVTSSVTNPRGGFVHTSNVNDITTSSGVVSLARLKWTPIAEGSETWTSIAA